MAKSIIRSKGWFLSQYLVLIVVFITFAVLIYLVGNVRIKTALIFAAALFYLIFGINHHIRENTFSARIFIEYLIISCLVFIIFWNLT